MIAGERLKYRGWYGAPDDESGLGDVNEVRWEAFEHDKNGSFVEPKYMSYSDYSGSLVERSNIEEFIEQFGEYQSVEWWLRTGSHGSRGIVLRLDADERVPEIGEFFEALDGYPLANEERHSELEMEVQNAAWADYGRSEFVRWLETEGIVFFVVPFLREVLVADAPKLESVVEKLPDETIVALYGGENVTDRWDKFVEALGAQPESIDNVWWSAMGHGSGGEMEIEGVDSVVFRYEDAMRGYYFSADHKGVDLEDLLALTEEQMKSHGQEAEWESFAHWVDGVAGNPLLPAEQLSVLLDAVQENGGEWSDQAERILRARMSRYA